MYHTICVNYEAKVKLDPEPEPDQSDGSETLYTVLIFCTIKAKKSKTLNIFQFFYLLNINFCLDPHHKNNPDPHSG